jgi:hypothetical protein
MPNWCMNNLTVSHDDPAKLQEFVDAYNSGNVCEHYLPCPKDENGEIIKDENSPNYWYVWNVNNWGTKWDFGKEEYHDPATIEDGKVVISFNTAWSPPIGFYNELENQDYKINATYFEPGMSFCGIYKNGKDNYIEYEDHDSIPRRIWDEYGLTDFFEMIEEDI